MKPIRIFFIVILSLVTFISWGKTFRVGNYEYETVKNGLLPNTVKLKKDFSDELIANIPETVNFEGVKYTVGIIDNEAFKNNKRVETITLPGSVYALSINAFKNLKTLRRFKALPATEDLKSTVIANSAKKEQAIMKETIKKGTNSFLPELAIGFCAFANCENLDSIDFSARKTVVLVPKNLYGTKAWGFSYPFENCKSLKSVIFGDVVFTDDGMKIFKGCHSLANVLTSSTNPSRFKKLFEPDCPFMTNVYPKISSMSESEYLAFLNQTPKTEPMVQTTYVSSQVADRIPHNGTIDSEMMPVVNNEFRTTADIMSFPIQRTDNNGNICSLLRVLSQQNNLSFEGNIVGDVEYKNQNQYWVYLSPGSKKIKINAPGIDPKEVDFNDYGIHHLESKRIYEYSYKGIPTQKLQILYSPAESMILIDGVITDGENGVVSVDLPLGEHSYIVAAKGYVSAEGVVKLKNEGQANLNINLTKTVK